MADDDHDAALNDIFGGALEDDIGSESEAGGALGSKLDDMFDILEQEATPAPIPGVAPLLSGSSGIIAALESPPAPSTSTSAFHPDAPSSPALAAPTSPLERGTTEAPSPFEPKLHPVSGTVPSLESSATAPVIAVTERPRRSPRTPLSPLLQSWAPEQLSELGTALKAAAPDVSVVARLCATHGCVPAQHRAVAWQVLLGQSLKDRSDPTAVPQAGDGGSPLDARSSELLRRDTAALFRSFDGADVKAAGLKPSIGQEDAVKVLASLCAHQSARYHPLLCKLLGPLLFLGLPRSAVARLFSALVLRCMPDLCERVVPATPLPEQTTVVDSAAAGANGATATSPASTKHSSDAAASSAAPAAAGVGGDVAGSTSHSASSSSSSSSVPSATDSDVVTLAARLAMLHDHLRSIVLYHDAELVAGLDRVSPGWYRAAKVGTTPTGAASGSTTSSNTPASGASVPSTGCVPASWLGAAFAGAASPHVVHPLFDRVIIFSALGAAAAETRDGPGASTLAYDVHAAAPCSDASFSLLLMAATVLLREAPSLKVICSSHSAPTAGAASAAAAAVDLPADAPAAAADSVAGVSSSGANSRRITQSASSSSSSGGGAAASAASSANNATYLISLTLEGAVKRVLAPSPTSTSVGGVPPSSTSTSPSPSDAYVEPTASWLSSAVSLSLNTPPSFGSFLRSMPRSYHAALAAAGGAAALSPACSEVIRVPARPVAAQLVYGWKRVKDAAAEAAASSSSTSVSDASRSADAPISSSGSDDGAAPVALLPSDLLGGVVNTTLHPVRFLVVDCRPIAHRQAGRFATAFHVDPRTCRGHVVSTAAAAAATATTAAAVVAAAAADVPSSGLDVSLGHLSGGGSSDEAAAAGDDKVPPLQQQQQQQVQARLTRDEDDDAVDDALPLASEPPSASSAVGIPLSQAVKELGGLSGTLHFAVLGVGTRLLPAAYEPAVLEICAEQDDARVSSLVAALTAAGCKFVSVVDGGYAALHAVVRQGTARALNSQPPPSRSATSPAPTGEGGAGTPGGLRSPSAAAAAAGPAEDVSYLHRSALVDHRPRGCPACRHIAVTRIIGPVLSEAMGRAAAAAAEQPGSSSGGAAAPLFPSSGGGGGAPSSVARVIAGVMASFERALSGVGLGGDAADDSTLSSGAVSVTHPLSRFEVTGVADASSVPPSTWDLADALTPAEREMRRAGDIQAEMDKWAATRDAAISATLKRLRTTEGSLRRALSTRNVPGVADEHRAEAPAPGAAHNRGSEALTAPAHAGDAAGDAHAGDKAEGRTAAQVKEAVSQGLLVARSVLFNVLAPPPPSSPAPAAHTVHHHPAAAPAAAAAAAAAGSAAPAAADSALDSTGASAAVTAAGAPVAAAHAGAAGSSSQSTSNIFSTSSGSGVSWKDAATARLKQAEIAARALASAASAAVAAPPPSSSAAAAAAAPAKSAPATAIAIDNLPLSEGSVATETTAAPTSISAPDTTRQQLSRTAAAAATSAKSALASGFSGLKSRIAATAAAAREATAASSAPASGGGFTVGQALDNVSSASRSRARATPSSSSANPSRAATGATGKPRAPSGASTAATTAAAAPVPRDPLAAVRLLELSGLTRGADFDLARWGALEGVTLFRCEKEKAELKPSIVIAVEEEEEEKEAAAAAHEGEGWKTSEAGQALSGEQQQTSAPASGTAPPPPAKLVRVPRYLCLVHERLLVLEPHPELLGHARIKSNHHVSELAKLSYSKRRPGRISLFYRRTTPSTGTTGHEGGGGEDVFVQRTYYVDLADEFIAGLQSAIGRLS